MTPILVGHIYRGITASNLQSIYLILVLDLALAVNGALCSGQQQISPPPPPFHNVINGKHQFVITHTRQDTIQDREEALY